MAWFGGVVLARLVVLTLGRVSGVVLGVLVTSPPQPGVGEKDVFQWGLQRLYHVGESSAALPIHA